jgi:hypothetical protein
MIASGWNGYLKSFLPSGCGADCHSHSVSRGLRNRYRLRIKIARKKLPADGRTNPSQFIASCLPARGFRSHPSNPRVELHRREWRGSRGAATKTAIKKALESGSIWARKYKTNPIWLGALGDRPTSRRGHQHNFAPELECTASRDSLVGGHHGVVGIFCFGLFPWLVCWSASFGRRFGALARRQS